MSTRVRLSGNATLPGEDVQNPPNFLHNYSIILSLSWLSLLKDERKRFFALRDTLDFSSKGAPGLSRAQDLPDHQQQ
ncbi:MAG TPA: hypothetical protein VKT82_11785 [Ktedonobacterales bacterium]|nr:hypothetical protein [Ktedonobacterales bacterium]